MASAQPSPYPPERLLFGPGPTQVEPSVYEAMTKPLVGYLDPYFFEVTADIRRLLQQAFGTNNEMTLAISGTGSSGMETAVSNFVEPGTKLSILSAGFFADRIAEMGRRHGADVVKFDKPWGETFSAEEARKFIERERPRVVAFVHAETSSGALQDPLAITGAAHDAGALVIADCVTSLGGMPIRVDESGIDIAYSCTQKGLSCPPGLAPFTVSPRAVERLNARTTPNDVWYLDLKLLRDYYNPPHKYHHTPPVSTFYALQEGLRSIEREGFEQRWQRHAEAQQQFVQGIEKLGLRMHVAQGKRIPTLDTVQVPESVDDAKVRARLMTGHGIEVGSGFGPLAGKIFRIGVMGPLATKENVALFLDAFGNALKD
jgi:alanine-glyoxylate transaminase / serine-glyoxylate transaminase / serine-pyruvate transaminase